MRLFKLVLPTMLFTVVLSAPAQSFPVGAQFGIEPGQVAPLEIGVNFNYLRANAPPAQCGCFSLIGGGWSLVINAPHGLGIVADVAAANASKVSGTAQNITILNYLAGPRYSYRGFRHVTPFAQGLAGGSNELSNYALVQNVNAFAADGGLGVSTVLTRRIGWTIVQADYIYSRLPNANNNRQSNLRIATGVIFRFPPR